MYTLWIPIAVTLHNIAAFDYKTNDIVRIRISVS